jgi:hypothetical protein
MPYLAVDEDGTEAIYSSYPVRTDNEGWWYPNSEWLLYHEAIDLPQGSIEKLIGRKLDWSDESVQI